jgi:hypothetical protein
MMVPLVAGLGLFVALPLVSAQTTERWQLPSQEPLFCGTPPPKKFKESNTIEVQGKLNKITPLRKYGQTTWQVTVGEQRYELILGDNKWLPRLAAELEGKTVRVVGRYHHAVYVPPVPVGPKGEKIAILHIPEHYESIVVEDLEKAPGAKPAMFVRIEIRGTIHLNTKLGAPPETLTVVTANGERFVLDFGKDVELRQLARQLDGQNVILKGTIDRWHWLQDMTCDPFRFDAPSLLEVKVQHLWPADGTAIELRIVDVKGQVLPMASPIVMGPAWQNDSLPSLAIRVDGHTIALECDGNAALQEKVANLVGHTVRVTGVLLHRIYHQPFEPGSKKLAEPFSLTVLVVDTIEEIKVDSYKEVKKVLVRGTLHWQGNQKVKGPNGEMQGTKKKYAWEGYYVEVDGKQYRIEVSNKMRGYLDPLVGQAVVVKGRLATRWEKDEPPSAMYHAYDIIVDSEVWRV